MHHSVFDVKTAFFQAVKDGTKRKRATDVWMIEIKKMHSSHRVTKNKDDGVSSQKHLADESVFVNGFSFLGSFASFGCLCPHLLYILQHHVAVPVKSLNTPKQFLVVSAVDEDLSVVTDALGEY